MLCAHYKARVHQEMNAASLGKGAPLCFLPFLSSATEAVDLKL
jgi:hypothetical protein